MSEEGKCPMTAKNIAIGAAVAGALYLLYKAACPAARGGQKKKRVPGIIIAGPPAGGKGTQCEKIVEKYGVAHISTGDLLRECVKNGTPEGKEAKAYMDKGALVPDDLIIRMVQARLARSDCQAKGWLLDGFPRTAVQARRMADAGIIADVMVLLEVPEDVVVERVEGRRSDPVTGKIYHMKFFPPPNDDAVKARLQHRSDDTKEAILKRLQVYKANLASILSFYEPILATIDGNRKKDDVSADVAAAIDKKLAAQ